MNIKKTSKTICGKISKLKNSNISTDKIIIMVSGTIILGLIILFIIVGTKSIYNSGSGSAQKKCAICGKAASYELQGSYFCAEHVNGLVEYYSE